MVLLKLKTLLYWLSGLWQEVFLTVWKTVHMLFLVKLKLVQLESAITDNKSVNSGFEREQAAFANLDAFLN